MKAIFKGKNSMGYEHGKQYDIVVRTGRYNNKDVIIVSCKGHADCPYGSIASFHKNWESNIC